MDEKILAAFRVRKSDGLCYRSMKMDDVQRIDRKSHIRQILRDYPEWGNMDNEQLDSMRLYRIPDGYILEDPQGREYYLTDKNIAAKEAQFRRVRAMMPFEFMNFSGKDFDWTKYKGDVSEQKNMVNSFILNFEKFKENGMGLYIYSGTKGSGKTMLACCLVNEIAKRYSGSVKFINTLDFLEMTKKGFKDGEEDIKSLCAAGLLVIDDIGVQMSREWTDTVFYRLINDRYAGRRPTIYTSNIPIAGLRMDERIVDRIESTTYLLNLPEEPIRQQVREKEKAKILEQIKTPLPARQH